MFQYWGLGPIGSGLSVSPQSTYGYTPHVIQLLQALPQQLQQLQQLEFVRQQQLQHIQQLVTQATQQLQYLAQHSLQPGFPGAVAPQAFGQPFQTLGTFGSTGLGTPFAGQPPHVM